MGGLPRARRSSSSTRRGSVLLCYCNAASTLAATARCCHPNPCRTVSSVTNYRYSVIGAFSSLSSTSAK